MGHATTLTDEPVLERQDGNSAAIGLGCSHRLTQCRSLVQQRKIVGDSLGFHLCPAPTFDILLDLYLAALERRPTYVWQSCVAANIPVSSAHRKISVLIAKGLVERAGTMPDKRLVSIQLSAHGIAMLDKLMDRLVQA